MASLLLTDSSHLTSDNQHLGISSHIQATNKWRLLYHSKSSMHDTLLDYYDLISEPSGDIDEYSQGEEGTNIRTNKVLVMSMFVCRGAMPRRRRTRSASPHGDCGGSPNEPRPQQRNAANARERARMRVLSKAFCRLKTTLPWVPADTKLSKLDTLRLATSYIAHLRAILTDEEVQPGIHPLNLVVCTSIHPLY
uniref:BHLH domain-containing protein n=2 Tax=Timema TaxID=61471 RepID=A0A7R9AMJ8_TIMSH|nr:unnamed protein product [Timema shepardi]